MKHQSTSIDLAAYQREASAIRKAAGVLRLTCRIPGQPDATDAQRAQAVRIATGLLQAVTR